MPAIREFHDSVDGKSHQLVKRHNWAYREPGVIFIFCVLGALGIAGIAAWIYKKRKASKSEKI
ncbi:hypothetical protein M433DRAFT_153249 [Acidomyces richmondensis BFW]|nr:MAG: hypothetical protein FE78DRAFT_88867 [Acidomyces sp. 'richmondensis']KYG46562.1 hypothetical protein M433DRAFT_153249 [Acidomyces richmondensis BFW]